MRKINIKKIKKEEKIIRRQKNKLAKIEEKLLEKEDNKFLKNKLNPLKSKVEDKIPDKVTNGLNKAFEKGFYYIFEKGTSLIEKSYNSDKLKNDADTNKYILSKEISSKNLKAIDKNVNRGNLLSKGITTVEGTALGFLGIGLPDIPIFIGVILRMIYEISLKYGFDYDDDKEKVFILNIICAGISDKEDRKKFFFDCDKISKAIDNNDEIYVDLDLMIKETSKKMVDSLLVSKFVQGIPLIGALGGAANYVVLTNISKMAKFKYKKRFINKL
ncbi:EcsC family protein [Clostridium butyricum]|uniref:EcsC family protein n=1 Tax=Clostridium butyricum TaxID=1492 RepID=UPI00168BB0FB|nr:EcsC family protein [Clostridium butyricum]MDB2152427.1 EcsC family protein [Clostridium butyricum]